MAKNALGSGPVTLEEGGMFQVANMNGTNPLILNGGAFHAADGFGSRWDADILLIGEVLVSAYNSLELNTKSGGISGTGGLVMAGNRGPWGRFDNQGILVLGGTNHYTGPTVVQLGTLVLAKAAALYSTDTARWTAEDLRVHKCATLVLKCGGPEEFTGESLTLLSKRLTDVLRFNGLMGGAILCLDTAIPCFNERIPSSMALQPASPASHERAQQARPTTHRRPAVGHGPFHAPRWVSLGPFSPASMLVSRD